MKYFNNINIIHRIERIINKFMDKNKFDIEIDGEEFIIKKIE